MNTCVFAESSFIARTPSREEIDSAVSLLRDLHFTVVPPSVAIAGVVRPATELDLKWRTLTNGASRIQLSPLHARIVQQLIDSQAEWCSRSRLRHALWGTNLPSSDPLPVHIYFVRRKLRDLTGRCDAVESSREGFRLAPRLIARDERAAQSPLASSR